MSTTEQSKTVPASAEPGWPVFMSKLHRGTEVSRVFGQAARPEAIDRPHACAVAIVGGFV
jgi:hypothetical protein